MSGHVFVVSEWLPKAGCEQELWDCLKKLMDTTRAQEDGCVRAHATKQLIHPGSPSKSKYPIVLLQEYTSQSAFDYHCATQYVKDAFKKYIEDQDTAIVADWQCRLFCE